MFGAASYSDENNIRIIGGTMNAVTYQEIEPMEIEVQAEHEIINPMLLELTSRYFEQEFLEQRGKDRENNLVILRR